MKYKVSHLYSPDCLEPPATLELIWVQNLMFLPCLLSSLFVFLCVFWSHSVINQKHLLLQCWEKALRMGEHPWLVVLRRQRSRFTLLIQSILCWRGVAKQPEGNEWDSNSGDLELQWVYHWCFAAYIIHNFCVTPCGLCDLNSEAYRRSKWWQSTSIKGVRSLYLLKKLIDVSLSLRLNLYKRKTEFFLCRRN